MSPRTTWLDRLATAIPLEVDLQLAEPDDLQVWPAIENEGVLIYQRDPA